MNELNTINLMIEKMNDSNKHIAIAFFNSFITNEQLKNTIVPIIEKVNDKNKNIVLSFINTFFVPVTKKESVPVTLNFPCAPVNKIKTCYASTKTIKPVSGNGHKSEKKRKLNDFEKDFITDRFLTLKGKIYRNDCVAMRTFLNESEDNPRLSESGNERSIISPFQVTGFITYLHREVSKGEIIFNSLDMIDYNESLVLKRSGKDIFRLNLAKELISCQESLRNTVWI